MKLSWCTLAHGDDHGYAVVAKELCLAVEKAGATFLEPWRFGADLTVIFALPSVYFFPAGRPRRDIVWHTMIEVEPTPTDWIPIMNLCGAVWAPSRWVAEQFEAQGVTVPIFVSGYGISPTVHHPHQRPARAGLKVGVWGDVFGSRKNVAMAIDCFVKADLPADATLEVKVNAPRWITPKTFTVDGKADDRVAILNGSWSIAVLTDWLRSLDVLLYLSGGEGYGLMPLEAMACGTPVIASIHTGMADYMTPANTLEVPTVGMVESPTYDFRFGYKAFQRLPDGDAVIERLRWAYFNHDALTALGTRAAADAATLTWDRAGEQALAQLQAHVTRR
jgi:glycosyltransferase involved in cell wall biosynthesis